MGNQTSGNADNRLLVVVVFILAVLCTAAITLLVVKQDAPKVEVAKTEIGGGVSAEEVEKTVAKFLKDNPHVIVQAFTAAKQAEANKELVNAKEAIQKRSDEILNDPKSPFTGNPNADVTIVKFSDYNCGYCKRVVPDLITLLSEDKNVKFVMKDFPILGPQSTENSKAALAVFTLHPEKWWDFHLALLKTTPRNKDQLRALIAKQGIDSDVLTKEMTKPEYQAQIQKNLSLGGAIGVRGTPAFVINGELVRGAVSLDIFKERVKAARANL